MFYNTIQNDTNSIFITYLLWYQLALLLGICLHKSLTNHRAMVCSDVHDKIWLLVCSVVAVWAGKWLLPSVNSHVACEEGVKVEPLATDVTQVVTLTVSLGWVAGGQWHHTGRDRWRRQVVLRALRENSEVKWRRHATVTSLSHLYGYHTSTLPSILWQI